MLFQKRVDRAMKHSNKQAMEKQRGPYSSEEQELSDMMEKGDLPAMMISAMLVLFPTAVIVIVLMCVIGMLPAFF